MNKIAQKIDGKMSFYVYVLMMCFYMPTMAFLGRFGQSTADVVSCTAVILVNLFLVFETFFVFRKEDENGDSIFLAGVLGLLNYLLIVVYGILIMTGFFTRYTTGPISNIISEAGQDRIVMAFIVGRFTVAFRGIAGIFALYKAEIINKKKMVVLSLCQLLFIMFVFNIIINSEVKKINKSINVKEVIHVGTD